MRTIRYLLTSESPIKQRVVYERLQKTLYYQEYTVDCKSIPSAQIQDNVEQPVGIGGLICCKNRILAALSSIQDVCKTYDAIISIENGISEHGGEYWDTAHIMIYSTEERVFFYNTSEPVYFEEKYFEYAKEKSTVSSLGWSYSVGEAMKDCGVIKNEKNWVSELACIKSGKIVDRHIQLDTTFWALIDRFYNLTLTPRDIYANLGYDLTFKKGVVFQDLGPIMARRLLFDLFMSRCILAITSYNIANGITFDDIDYIIGIGARGFYLGPLLAQHFGAGFIPIRKQGKLPGKTIQYKYSTEYSTDVMEIQLDAIPNDENDKTVLIVDDLVATGGSLIGGCELVKRIGNDRVTIMGCFCPLKVDGLLSQAQAKLGEINVKLITL